MWNWKCNCIVTSYCDVSIVPIYANNVMSLILKIKSANNKWDMALKPIYVAIACGFRFVNISQNSIFDFYSNRMLLAHYCGHYYLIYFFLNFSIRAKGQVRKLLMPIFVKPFLHYWNMCIVKAQATISSFSGSFHFHRFDTQHLLCSTFIRFYCCCQNPLWIGSRTAFPYRDSTKYV